MDAVAAWTGLEANALRIAMRMSLRAFAEHLGVSLGTVAAWHRRGSSVRPTPELQSVLDAALSQASDDIRERFGLVRTQTAGQSAPSASEPDPARSATVDPADVLLTVQVSGRPVTLPLEAIAAAAQTTAETAGPDRITRVGSPAASPVAATATDERAYELFVRGCGLLGTNSRQHVAAAQLLLQRAVDRDPRFARAIAARGYTSWRQYFSGWSRHGQALADALADAQAAMELEPGSVFAHTTFVRACWDMGWHEQALEAGRRVFTRKPDSLDAAIAYARALNNAGMAEYALPLIVNVLSEDPTHPAAVKLNIWSRLMVGDSAGAIAVSQDYLAGNPADANTRWAVALALAYTPGAGGQAVAVAEDGLHADPGDITLWVLLGYLHRHRGDREGARRVWADGLSHAAIAAVEGGEANRRTQAWVANLSAALGDVSSVLELTERLTSEEPRNGYLRYRLAHALAEAGRPDEALAMLGTAVSDGFLSAQLLRREQILGLVSVQSLPAFAAVRARLADQVSRCRAMYAPDLKRVALADGADRAVLDADGVAGPGVEVVRSGETRL